MNNDIILSIDSVTKSYVKNIINHRGQSEDERNYVLNNFDLEIPRQKITALFGGNGAGKTTLFNIISGFTNVDSGKIILKKKSAEIELLKKSPDEIARLGIGRMFQDNHIFQNMTVLDNMLISDIEDYGEIPFLSLIFPKKSKRIECNRIEKARNIFITLFGESNEFWKKRDQKALKLSYGQQRLLGLARLLMGNYELILLDEPTAGVNPTVNEQLVAIIKQLVQKMGLTVFLIEHNMKVMLDLADFCCFMSNGEIADLGYPEDVIGNDEVRKRYIGV